MKKRIGKIVSAVLTAALVFGGVTAVPFEVKAAEEEQTAFLMFTDRDWAFGNWDSSLESATTVVSGDGTYTVTLNASEVGGDGETAANGAMVFCVDVEGLGASVTDISAISLDDLTIEADGEEVDVDLSGVVTGDIEENGNFRIEIYNEYGDTAEASPIDFEGLSFVDTLSVTFTLSGIEYGEPKASEEEEEVAAVEVEAVDLNGTYNAYIGIQTPVYSFRNAFDDATYGLGTDYFNQITGWSGNDAVALDGTITDAVIEGNGTYTISITGMNFSSDEFASQDYMNLIFISTDIPNSGEITISDIVLNVDGREPSISPIVSPDSPSYLNMLIQNIWNDDVATIGYYSVPPTDMSITFTVSGFAYDNEAAAAAADDSAAAADEDAADAADEGAAADEASSSSSGSTGVIVVVVIVVVVVVVVAAVLLSKKKDDKAEK